MHSGVTKSVAMRDPQGRRRFEGKAAFLDLLQPLPASAFLYHPIATNLVRTGHLVPFEWRAPQCLVSPRYSFVSQPTEWCDGQFLAAARFTLDVAEAVLEAGFELKDASAWNIIFDGAKPVFCDHLSFQSLRSRQWWAFGQFCRHFTFPLAAAKLRNVHASEVFLTQRDGLTPERARALLGSKGLVSRLLPLLLKVGADDAMCNSVTEAAVPLLSEDVLHTRLIAYARRSLFVPPPAQVGERWPGYVTERNHYNKTSSKAKFEKVCQWLTDLAPGCVLDLGCNTGEFSRAALDQGARVIAVDGDHNSVQELFKAAGDSRGLHPVVANLADLHGGRGWNGREHLGLLDRLTGQADVTLMLALTHHLHFSESIPIKEIAAFAFQVTKSHLLLELLPEDDPMVQRLAVQRRRPTTGFGLVEQLDCFTRQFELVDRYQLPQSGRQLALLRKRP